MQQNMVKERTPVVEIDGLVKSYGNERVVDELSLRVQRGEIFGILGGNGAGKTSINSLILNLYLNRVQGTSHPKTFKYTVLLL